MYRFVCEHRRALRRAACSERCVAVLVAQHLELRAQLGIVPRLDRHLHVPVHPVAIDAWRAMSSRISASAFDRHVPHARAHPRPDQPLELRLARRRCPQSPARRCGPRRPSRCDAVRAARPCSRAPPDAAPSSSPRCRPPPRTRHSPRCLSTAAAQGLGRIVASVIRAHVRLWISCGYACLKSSLGPLKLWSNGHRRGPSVIKHAGQHRRHHSSIMSFNDAPSSESPPIAA